MNFDEPLKEKRKRKNVDVGCLLLLVAFRRNRISNKINTSHFIHASPTNYDILTVQRNGPFMINSLS